MTEKAYTVINERTGELVATGLTLEEARRAVKVNPYDLRTVWTKALVRTNCIPTVSQATQAPDTQTTESSDA